MSLIATTALDIVQMAVANLGETVTIASITSPTTKAEKLGQLFYERTRDRMLGSHGWSFATKRVALVAASEARSGWGACFVPPADMVRPICLDAGYRGDAGLPVLTSDGATTVTGRIPHALELNDAGTGHILCTDLSPASLVYVAQVVSPALWSDAFIEALTWALSARLVMPLAVKPDVAKDAIAMARASFLAAVAEDENRAQKDRPPDSELISARSW